MQRRFLRSLALGQLRMHSSKYHIWFWCIASILGCLALFHIDFSQWRGNRKPDAECLQDKIIQELEAKIEITTDDRLKSLLEELKEQSEIGLDASVSGLSPKVLNNLLRAQATGNQLYFELAEKDFHRHLEKFIKPNLPKSANFDVTLEIAGGHGRNTNFLKEFAKKVITIDINIQNVRFMQERFVNDENVVVYLTNGVKLPPEVHHGVTFLYSWDAMVHFDKEIIYSYLEDAGRVMVQGAYGFLHHSIVPECPKTMQNGFCSQPNRIGSDPNNPHQRNSLSPQEFVAMATRAGFDVISQTPIVWDENLGQTDCISIIQKNVSNTKITIGLVNQAISE